MSMRNPLFVAALMFAVLGAWVSWRLFWSDDEQDASISLWSPTIVAVAGEHGTWHLDWPRWPDRKGDPRLRVDGEEDASSGESGSMQLLVRVHPADAASGFGMNPDDDGWFKVGTGGDPHLRPTIDRRASTIEYRVTEDYVQVTGSGRLHIYGTFDDALRDADAKRFFVFLYAAVVVASGLFCWLFALLLPSPRTKGMAGTNCDPR